MRDKITHHLKTWESFHKKAVAEEMTNFAYLSKDKLVQTEDTKVLAKSAVIFEEGKKMIYKPKMTEK